ncbi:hypothetical protein [Streptomyces sp. NPDC050704]|uniref:hypothetical protein n=1 Tax=Streptomyces sp. NPDC050704 TaxID=3157219 RepID=UPI003429F5F9
MPPQSSLLLPARPGPEVRPLARRPPRPRTHRRIPLPLVAVLCVAPLYGIWAALLETGGGDLAAQYAWAGFAARHPDAAYGLFWYGGTHTANYSVLSPELMALLGVRTVSVLAGLSATWWLAALFRRTARRAPVWPALLGALGLWGNVAMGRTTFALGLAFGLAGLLALAGRRPRPGRLTIAALGALLATLASPVAGLFVLVAGAAYLLDRQYAKSLALAVPPVVAVGLTTLLFPFQGEHPMAAGRMTLPLLLAAAVALAAPREWRVVRAGAAVYAVGVVLTYLIPSPVGSNVERLAVHLGPALLLAALLNPGSGAARRSVVRRVRTCALGLALIVSATWSTQSAIHSAWGLAPVPAWATHTGGVITELGRLGADRGRVEVVNATNHREAALFAPHVQVMRGWNRQLDVERGRLFYDGSLDGARYHAWLRRWAVGYVVVPDAEPEGASVPEAALIRAGQDWLEPVWHDAYWKIYRVADPLPLASAPAEVLNAGEADVVLKMPRAGTVTVRIAHSPWLRAEGACVRADGPWTRLTAPGPGVYRLTSSYAAGRSTGPGCR